MKRWLLLILLFSSVALGANPGDRVIKNPNDGKDIVVELDDSNGNSVEAVRFSPPLGDTARSIGEVGVLANEQGPLQTSDIGSGNMSIFHLSGDLNDDGNNGYNLTDQGSVKFNRLGFFGREDVIRCDGVDDAPFVDNAFFNFGDSDFSFGAWIKLDDWSDDAAGGTFMGAEQSSDVRGWKMFAEGDRVVCEVNAGDSGPSQATWSFTTPLSQDWHHLVCTYDAATNTTTLYVDTQSVATHVEAAGPSSNKFRVCAARDTASGFFNGELQDVFVVDKTLTPAEINTNYAKRFTDHQQISGGHFLASDSFPWTNLEDRVAYWHLDADGNDDSGATMCSGGSSACNFTLNGSPSFSGLDIFGQVGAVDFDGTDDYLKSSSNELNPGDSDFSIGGWFFNDSWVDGSGSTQTLFMQGSNDTDMSWFAYLFSGGGLVLRSSETSDNWDTQVTHNFSDQKNIGWHHIVLTYEKNGTWKLYVDGNRELTWNQIIRSATTANFTVGDFEQPTGSPANGWFRGRMSQLFFTPYTLSSGHIRRLASAKITHNKALTSDFQFWQAVWQSENQDITTILENGWISDMKANNLFVNFKGVGSGSKVLIQSK